MLVYVSSFARSFTISSQMLGPTQLKFSGVDEGHPRMVLGGVVEVQSKTLPVERVFLFCFFLWMEVGGGGCSISCMSYHKSAL